MAARKTAALNILENARLPPEPAKAMVQAMELEFDARDGTRQWVARTGIFSGIVAVFCSVAHLVLG